MKDDIEQWVILKIFAFILSLEISVQLTRAAEQ